MITLRDLIPQILVHDATNDALCRLNKQIKDPDYLRANKVIDDMYANTLASRQDLVRLAEEILHLVPGTLEDHKPGFPCEELPNFTAVRTLKEREDKGVKAGETLVLLSPEASVWVQSSGRIPAVHVSRIGDDRVRLATDEEIAEFFGLVPVTIPEETVTPAPELPDPCDPPVEAVPEERSSPAAEELPTFNPPENRVGP